MIKTKVRNRWEFVYSRIDSAIQVKAKADMTAKQMVFEMRDKENNPYIYLDSKILIGKNRCYLIIKIYQKIDETQDITQRDTGINYGSYEEDGLA